MNGCEASLTGILLLASAALVGLLWRRRGSAPGVHHLAIKTGTPHNLARFYAETFGLSEITRHHDAAGLRSVWLQTRGAILMLERLEEGETPGYHLLALDVAPGRHHAFCRRHPGITAEPDADSDFTTYLRDPDGNRLGISSWPQPKG